MTDFVVLVPSRGRPQSVREMHDAFANTCTADTTLIFVIDDDDPHFEDYREEARMIWEQPPFNHPVPLDLICHNPYYDGHGMVAALNKAAQNVCINWPKSKMFEGYPEEAQINPAPFAIGFQGDDHRPRTAGWDSRYLDALDSGALFVYGDDLLQGPNFPTQVAMRSDVVQKLGYMAPPQFFHLCIDLVWKDWGQGINRLAYLPDVVVEHMHPANGKAKLDPGYERVNSIEVTTKDAERYYTWRTAELPAELEKLREIDA